MGAGCAGSLAASEVAAQGFNVALFEEHSQVGVPSHCSGVVSTRGLDLLGLSPSAEFVQKEVDGALIYSPSGIQIEIRRNHTVAYILNRVRFDQYLAEKAKQAGADLKVSTRVSELLVESNRVIGVKSSQGDVHSRVVIDASGAGSRLASPLGLETISPQGILPGFQYELSAANGGRDVVEVFFGERYAPGFFAWSIPTGRGTFRVGLASRRGPVKDLLNRFVEEKFPSSTTASSKSGSVLVSGPIRKTCADGFLLAGDAAGQVKPTTGGGIFVGGYCGRLAGIAAGLAIKRQDTSERTLNSLYERKWRSIFSNELSKMKAAKRILDRINDNAMDALFRMIRDSGLAREITEIGDMDFQGAIIQSLIIRPQVASLLLPFAKEILGSYLRRDSKQ